MKPKTQVYDDGSVISTTGGRQPGGATGSIMIKGMRQAAWNALHFASSALGFGIVTYRQRERLETIRAIRKLKASCEMVLTPLEASQLFSLLRSTSKLGGATAEVGVFRGGSARVIRQADAVRPLHLFDTFEGLPEPARTDVEIHLGPFEKNEFSSSLEQVQNNLKSCTNVYFHPGLFPETGKAVENEKFSFVHADVDLYASTRSVLEFFYPRLIHGAIILAHDFYTTHGPHKAFTEFFENLPEPLTSCQVTRLSWLNSDYTPGVRLTCGAGGDVGG